MSTRTRFRVGWDDWESFVRFWEKHYVESKKYPEKKFLQHLKWKGGKLTARNVEFLFGWKSEGTWKWDPEPTVKWLSDLNTYRFKEDKRILDLAYELAPGGAVKRRFICHIVSPKVYPIWDINVLIAYFLLVKGKKISEKRALNLRDEENRYLQYRRFFNRTVEHVSPRRVLEGYSIPPFRRLDQALFAFGSVSKYDGFQVTPV